ncbi:LapA family protein, partial [Clavibacter phaseoli]
RAAGSTAPPDAHPVAAPGPTDPHPLPHPLDERTTR